jgi:AcrR family transcriptional regulator
MVTTRNSRDDVVRAAGRLFADRGYHGTSMRDLGKELGLLGSSLYSHVSSKQDLLVEVVEEGARLFEESAERALATPGGASDRLDALIAGHVAVVLDNIEVARTYLNEARMLDDQHRSRIIDARDHYEDAFRTVIREGIADGSIGRNEDPKITSIFILSILNAIERWYRSDGELDRDALVARLSAFAREAIS